MFTQIKLDGVIWHAEPADGVKPYRYLALNESSGYILIKGQAILPTPVEKITRLEVE